MKRKISWALSLAITLSAFALRSQEASQADERGFSLQNFQLAPGYDSFLTVEGARVNPDPFALRLSGMLNYQYRPLVVQSCNTVSDGRCTEWGDDDVAVVAHHLSLDLAGAISLFGFAEAGLVIPTVLFQSGEGITDGDTTIVEEPNGTIGISDIRLHLKLDILQGLLKHEQEKFSLAFIPVISLPVGNAVQKSSFMGDSSVVFHPKVAFGAKFDKFRLGANLGYLWRESQDFFLSEVGPRLSFGAAGEYFIDKKWSAVLELFGQNGFTTDLSASPLELDAAARYEVLPGLITTAGLGTGILAGVGSPRVRIFAGAIFQPRFNRDRDGDGLPNREDNCPDEPEDADGFEDENGCPDPDNDQDGVSDSNDPCPTSAEDTDGFEDADGCPDNDNDQDGVVDAADDCPIDPEDVDNFDDLDGCPDPDNDKDTILDGNDNCPDTAEDIDEFEDSDGCPDPDNDQDGFLDVSDQCPNEREVLNGFEDDDGCPDKGQELVVVQQEKIELLQKIKFAYNSDKIVGKKSFDILDSISTLLIARPDVSIRIEGHTDSQGGAAFNHNLSTRRAASVMNYIVSKGVTTDRLESVGFGPDKPVDTNDTLVGRANNRRVEFVITNR